MLTPSRRGERFLPVALTVLPSAAMPAPSISSSSPRFQTSTAAWRSWSKPRCGQQREFSSPSNLGNGPPKYPSIVSLLSTSRRWQSWEQSRGFLMAPVSAKAQSSLPRHPRRPACRLPGHDLRAPRPPAPRAVRDDAYHLRNLRNRQTRLASARLSHRRQPGDDQDIGTVAGIGDRKSRACSRYLERYLASSGEEGSRFRARVHLSKWFSCGVKLTELERKLTTARWTLITALWTANRLASQDCTRQSESPKPYRRYFQTC